jgi:putative NADH-flavin reductase
MKVTIFGANGATGKLLAERSLAAGHTVTALVRNPDSFPFREKVHLVEGSVFDPAVVVEALKGADVAFSALGAHSPFRNENVLPRAIPVIVQAMQQTGVRRIIALGSAGALASSLDKQPAWLRWFVQKIVFTSVMKWPVYEQRVQYNVLSDSRLDWTMVLPPVLTNGRAQGVYRIDGEALPAGSSHISRSDVADFMMQQLTSRDWIGRGVYVGV